MTQEKPEEPAVPKKQAQNPSLKEQLLQNHHITTFEHQHITALYTTTAPPPPKQARTTTKSSELGELYALKITAMTSRSQEKRTPRFASERSQRAHINDETPQTATDPGNQEEPNSDLELTDTQRVWSEKREGRQCGIRRCVAGGQQL